jgi:selenocysteine lyase/cysteine desulfurase
MRLLGSNATVRTSFYLYNTNHEVDALCDALSAAGDFFTL